MFVNNPVIVSLGKIKLKMIISDSINFYISINKSLQFTFDI